MIKFLNPSIEKPYIHFQSLYQEAIENGDVSLLRKVLNQTDLTNYPFAGTEDRTLLHLACIFGERECVGWPMLRGGGHRDLARSCCDDGAASRAVRQLSGRRASDFWGVRARA